MASHKGKILTIGILVAISLLSFVVWFIPQGSQINFSVSDFDSHLSGIKEIQKTIEISLDEEFQRVLKGEMDPKEYIKRAEAATTQVNSQIIDLIESGPPKEWEESYSGYIQGLKEFNSYIRETIVSANLIEQGKTGEELTKSIEKANGFKDAASKTFEESDAVRP